MALRDKLETNVRPFLDEDERIQGIFSAQTSSPYWWLVSGWIALFRNGYRTVVATDRRILVVRNTRWRITKMTSIAGVHPRSTKLGPASGLWFKTTALGETLYINKRFHGDIWQIDSPAKHQTEPLINRLR